jgi:predicted nucleotidyltransferase
MNTNNNTLKAMTIRELKAILKQFRSGLVGMGMRDIYLMHLIEDEIDRRTNR